MGNKIYGEAIPTPSDPHAWAAVLYSDEMELTRAGADTRAEAEQLVVYFLQKLATFAKRGFEDDDA